MIVGCRRGGRIGAQPDDRKLNYAEAANTYPTTETMMLRKRRTRNVHLDTGHHWLNRLRRFSLSLRPVSGGSARFESDDNVCRSGAESVGPK